MWNEIKYKAEVIRDFEPLPRVLSSPQKLAQVFMNLLVNAAQSIEKQGTIHLQTRILENSIIVAITDTGSGIPDHILPKIFDPFFTTKPVGKGTGLGLNISYNIMQQLGGDIDVDTTPGEGSTFRVHIPLREP
ncbi:ATP-binding protein [Desulfobotulus sp. H1]|uniref:histidine kinase n=1 Tax=Desulfobotulus pelophilus TaxID=2823377 RepID=A0ABT3N708_9BACT|nr:ATP-binding protein [Desulfobotulus pelophilus]